MIASGDAWHFFFVKSVSALLHDQTRHWGRKHFCLGCLSSFTTGKTLQKHEEACKGLNTRPTRKDGGSGGEATETKFYRGDNAWEEFLKTILREEKKIRGELRKAVPIKMGQEDWEDLNLATNCHICKKPLMRESFSDSFSVYDKNSGSYCGQAHKKCHYREKFIEPRYKLQPLDKMHKWIKNGQKDCLYRLKPWCCEG